MVHEFKPGKLKLKLFASALTVFSAHSLNAAPPAQETEARLEALHSASSQAEFDAVFSAPIPRYDLDGNSVSQSAFNAREIHTGAYIKRKQESRNQRFPEPLGGRSGIQSNDRPEEIIGRDAATDRKLENLEKAGLMKGNLAESPWSDDYWAIYKGVLGNRYTDWNLEALGTDWGKRFKYVQEADNVASKILEKAVATGAPNASSLDNLSPAEKYDILVGDTHFTLTKKMWAEGKRYADSNGGNVETWMGICHGWAPAAYMLPRPRNQITVVAADGKTKLNFYPSDIKGLASQLWASAAPHYGQRFIGGRCNTKSPAATTVGDKQRTQDQSCFDNNPGTWHLAVTHLIGKAKRSFVLDATYDYEVWNQPVYGYSYSYFNPLTRKSVTTLKAAQVELAQMGDKDLFKATRSPQTKSIVGVAMQLAYVAETSPSHARNDDASKDLITTVDYLYDLELDANGNIIGGEWYHKTHPDFLWTYDAGARAQVPGDAALKTTDWKPGAPLPAAWTGLAKRTSASGLPMATIVEALIAEANAASPR